MGQGRHQGTNEKGDKNQEIRKENMVKTTERESRWSEDKGQTQLTKMTYVIRVLLYFDKLSNEPSGLMLGFC